MAEHDQLDDDILLDDTTPEDHSAAMAGQMETRTRVLVHGPGSLGQPLVDRIETTGLNAGALAETVEIRMTYGACFHVLHTGAEAAAVCACGCARLLCSACAGREENLCARCRRPVAGPCQQRPVWAAPGTMLCAPCRDRERTKNLVIFLIVAAVAGFLLWRLTWALSQIRSPF